MKTNPETLIEYLHKISQEGYEVKFTGDFDGMVTVTYSSEFEDDGYIRHEHLSYPGSSMQELTNAILKSLAYFANEIEAGKPQKDGLAK